MSASQPSSSEIAKGHVAFLTEDRLTFTPETAEPLGVSQPEAVDSL